MSPGGQALAAKPGVHRGRMVRHGSGLARQDRGSASKPRQTPARSMIRTERRAGDSRGAMAGGSLVDVRNLSVSFDTMVGPRPAIVDVSFEIADGEAVAVVGESGSGKTVTALSTIGLLPDNANVVSGSIDFGGRRLSPENAASYAGVRGARMAMIFQEPMTSLNPVLTVGEQIAETMVRHQGLDWRAAHKEALVLLDRVGIPDAGRRARQYAHQLSGGMRQRVMIAGAVSCRPQLLIADEPTTALDVTIQAQILDLIRELQAELEMGVLFITHDLGVVSAVADRIYVMYAGRVVESGPASEVLRRPHMPYTMGLLRSLPRRSSARGALESIPGNPPQGGAPLPGCPFAPRCEFRIARCEASVPDLVERGGGRTARCIRSDSIASRQPVISDRSTTAEPRQRQQSSPRAYIEVRGLTKHFPLSAGPFARSRRIIRAVDDVALDVRRGEVVALVGESGSGKTTMGRCILRLEEPTAGSIVFDGIELTRLSRRELKRFRRRMQIVFQDPFSSLNPHLTVGEAIGEPIRVHGLARGSECEERVARLLEVVGLDPDHSKRRPQAFSGGQRQRIAIARALALDPDFIVADEAVSALDVSIRAQITNLLQDLRRRLSLTLLFIAHDLALVRHIADRVVVLYLGRVMERGPVEAVFSNPRHPYTQALLSAVPEPDVDPRRDRVVLSGDVPSPIFPPSGCVFRTRCPVATDECASTVPPPVTVDSGHTASCIRLT